MIRLPEPQQSVELELSQAESLTLVSFLRNLMEEIDHPDGFAAIGAAYDKLEEADAVGVWLRERVRAELSAAEAGEITEAIAVRLDEDQLLDSVVGELTEIRQRLADCLNGPGARKSHDRFSDCT
jgi:hypothetical protein